MEIKCVCNNCGKEIPENTDICPFCNYEFEEILNVPQKKQKTKKIEIEDDDEEFFIDERINNNVSGLVFWGKFFRAITYIVAIISFLASIILLAQLSQSDNNEINDIIFIISIYMILLPICLIINGTVICHLFSWLSNTLDCLHRISKKK